MMQSLSHNELKWLHISVALIPSIDSEAYKGSQLEAGSLLFASYLLMWNPYCYTNASTVNKASSRILSENLSR